MKSKTISTQTAAFHIGHSGTVLQKHYDVSVIIASVLRPTLKRTLHSIFRQDFSGQIHILIGIDKSKKSRQFLYDICKSQPKNCLITVLDLGYSTSVRHGGLRLAQDGGSLRTTLTYMTNSRYISYLDDDNWWGSQHLSTVLTAIKSQFL